MGSRYVNKGCFDQDAPVTVTAFFLLRGVVGGPDGQY